MKLESISVPDLFERIGDLSQQFSDAGLLEELRQFAQVFPPAREMFPRGDQPFLNDFQPETQIRLEFQALDYWGHLLMLHRLLAQPDRLGLNTEDLYFAGAYISSLQGMTNAEVLDLIRDEELSCYPEGIDDLRLVNSKQIMVLLIYWLLGGRSPSRGDLLAA